MCLKRQHSEETVEWELEKKQSEELSSHQQPLKLIVVFSFFFLKCQKDNRVERKRSGKTFAVHLKWITCGNKTFPPLLLLLIELKVSPLSRRAYNNKSCLGTAAESAEPNKHSLMSTVTLYHRNDFQHPQAWQNHQTTDDSNVHIIMWCTEKHFSLKTSIIYCINVLSSIQNPSNCSSLSVSVIGTLHLENRPIIHYLDTDKSST